MKEIFDVPMNSFLKDGSVTSSTQIGKTASYHSLMDHVTAWVRSEKYPIRVQRV